MQIEIQIPDTKSSAETLKIKTALQNIVNNLTPENLVLISEKSKKAGINEKLQKYKNLI